MAQIPIPTGATNKYTCVNCNVGFQSSAEQRSHFKTEWHLYNLKRKVCRLEPIDHDSFQKIQELTPKQETQSEPSTREEKALAKSERQQKRQLEADQIPEEEGEKLDPDEEDDWEEVDDEELLDEDYDDDEVQEMLARVVKPTVCLFCDKKSPKIKDNLGHMTLRHGFFLPEEQYLIDLEGIMVYLGFKVGAGMTCLWCNKQFTTVHGVRLHMLYKDHCKILYDQEKAVGEFKDFYDYSGQVQIPMKPMDQLVVSKKRRGRDESRSLVKHKVSGTSRQLVVRSAHAAALVSQNYHSRRSIKKFNAESAKRLLHIGMQNNNAMRGRIRQQNPM